MLELTGLFIVDEVVATFPSTSWRVGASDVSSTSGPTHDKDFATEVTKCGEAALGARHSVNDLIATLTGGLVGRGYQQGTVTLKRLLRPSQKQFCQEI